MKTVNKVAATAAAASALVTGAAQEARIDGAHDDGVRVGSSETADRIEQLDHARVIIREQDAELRQCMARLAAAEGEKRE